MLENSGHEFLSASDAAKYLYSYRSFADPSLLLIAEIHKKPAGMCITLPNYDESHIKKIL